MRRGARGLVAGAVMAWAAGAACAADPPTVADQGSAVPASAGSSPTAPATAPPPGTLTTPGTAPRGTAPSIAIQDPSSSTRPPRPATTPPPPLAAVRRPFAVGAVQTTFTDTDRAAGANPVRVLRTTIWYPAAGPASQRGGQLPAAAGTFPLVVFAHGWAAAAADYRALLMEVAAAGYIVAAPDFPRTSSAVGAVDEQDTFNQPADLTFVISQMQGPMNADGVLAGRVWSGPVGAIGHSDGAMTVLGLGDNECCLDRRVGSVVALSGKVTGWPTGWFPADARPVLNVHGTADTVNPYTNGTVLFDRAPRGSAMVTVTGGDHSAIFTTRDSVGTIAKVTVDHLDDVIRKDPDARRRLATDGAVEGFTVRFS